MRLGFRDGRGALLVGVLSAFFALSAGCKRSAGGDRADAPAPPHRDNAAPRDANGRLDDLAREHFDATFAESPTVATWQGAHQYDDRLDDVGPEAQARRLGRLQGMLDRLGSIPEDQLDVPHRFDRLLVERELKLALFEATVERPLERNPGRYMAIIAGGIDELLARDFSPLGERLHLVTQRLRRVPALLELGRKNLKNPPELLVRRAIELGLGVRAFVADTLPRVVGTLDDDKLAAEFRAAQADALRALDDFNAAMQKEPAHAKAELLLGRERFAEWLRIGEAIDIPVEQLAAAGERELQAARRDLDETARIVAPGKGATEALRALEDDHGKPEDILASVSAALDGVIAFVRERRLLTPPESRPKVVEMPPYLWGVASVTLWGPFEQRVLETPYYVEPVDRSWDARRRDEHLRAFPRSQIQLTTLHEACPGHFVQVEAARHAPSLVRRAARSEAFVEGWADYGAQVMLEQGYGGGDARLRLALLRDQVVRLARFVAVVRLHGMNAKLDEAARLFTDVALLDEWAARREAERAAADPHAMLPALGRLLLLKLRADLRIEKGDAFSLRDFHDRVLGQGAPPPALLRPVMLRGAAELPPL